MYQVSHFMEFLQRLGELTQTADLERIALATDREVDEFVSDINNEKLHYAWLYEIIYKYQISSDWLLFGKKSADQELLAELSCLQSLNTSLEEKLKQAHQIRGGNNTAKLELLQLDYDKLLVANQDLKNIIKTQQSSIELLQKALAQESQNSFYGSCLQEEKAPYGSVKFEDKKKR